jgi:hypothetical protein
MSLFRKKGKTIPGLFNRYRRKQGKGTPLFWTCDKKLFHYSGIDQFDHHLFDAFITYKAPHCFEWGADSPSTLYMPVLDWIREHMQGRALFSYDPMILSGYILLEHPDDAFDFRMRFSEPQRVLPDKNVQVEAKRIVEKYGLDVL